MAASHGCHRFFILKSSQYREFRAPHIFDFKQIITIFAEFCINSDKPFLDKIKN